MSLEVPHFVSVPPCSEPTLDSWRPRRADARTPRTKKSLKMSIKLGSNVYLVLILDLGNSKVVDTNSMNWMDQHRCLTDREI